VPGEKYFPAGFLPPETIGGQQKIIRATAANFLDTPPWPRKKLLRKRRSNARVAFSLPSTPAHKAGVFLVPRGGCRSGYTIYELFLDFR
jgi:hypothetical protein